MSSPHSIPLFYSAFFLTSLAACRLLLFLVGYSVFCVLVSKLEGEDEKLI